MENNISKLQDKLQRVNGRVQMGQFIDTVIVVAYLDTKGQIANLSKEEIADRYRLEIASDPQKEILNVFIDSLEEYANKASDEEFEGLKDIIQHTKSDKVISSVESLISGYDVTPDYINDLLVRLADIKLKDHVLDPSVGIGGTLLRVLNDNNEQYCVGQEIVDRTAAIAVIQLRIAGAENSRILSGDTLNDPKYVKDGQLEKFDVVVSSPPFGVSVNNSSFASNDKYNRFSFGQVPRSRADWGFIMNAISSTNDSGRSILIMPTGVTFRSGVEESVRRELLKNDYFEAVISLSKGLYSLRVSIPVTILIFNKNKAINKQNKVLFINVPEKDLLTTKGTDQVPLKSIDKIVEVERDFKSIEGYSQVVDVSSINPATMEAAHYVPNSRYHVDKSPYVVNLMEFVKGDNYELQDVATIDRGYNLNSRSEDPHGKYQFVKISDINDGEIDYKNLVRGNVNSGSKVDNYEISENDLLLSIRGATNKVVIAKNVQPNTLFNSNMVRIRTNKKIDPEYLRLFLESPVGIAELDSMSMGTTIRQIKINNLKEYLIPKISLEDQREAIKTYKQQDELLKAKYQQLQQADKLNLDNLYDKMHLNKLYEKVEKNDED